VSLIWGLLGFVVVLFSAAWAIVITALYIDARYEAGKRDAMLKVYQRAADEAQVEKICGRNGQ
jgi:hypothetical protein